RHFVERELVALLNGSRGWGGRRLEVGRVRLATNRIAVELPCPELGDAGLCIDFELHDRSLTAGVARPGWLPHLSAEQRDVLRMGLAGLYKKAGVSAVWQPTGAAPLTDGANGQAAPGKGCVTFAEVPVPWRDWVEAWESDREGRTPAAPFV